MKRHNIIRGFTFLELIMVIVITGIIVGMSATLVSQGFRAYFTAKQLLLSDTVGGYVFERMTRELHNIRSNADFTVSSTTATSITFTTSEGNTITYQLSGNQLLNISNSGTTVLADKVQSLNFSFFDNSGNATSTNVHYIVISMGIIVNGSGTVTNLTTGVYLWNIK